jgi:probable H4MPT-linked C1 transfer pathway protein
MTAQETHITGWDIGGAHLKVAQCDLQGQLLHSIEIPCPLWQGIEHLQQAIQTAQQQLGAQQALAAITMTGELVDIFADRQTGVTAILDCVTQFIPDEQCIVYAGEAGWFSPSKAKEHWQQVASRNWQASAVFAAKQVEQGLFIDIGSTTSDIIPIQNNQAIPNALTDFERQANSELHYAGAIRTPLIAIAHQAPFDGKTIRLAAEVFATTGDCWCLLDELDPLSIGDSSADGQTWQPQDCARRLARLLGTDAHHYPMEHWQQLAHWFAQQQIAHLLTACETVLAAHTAITPNAPIIGAGIGRFIVKQCAKQLGRAYIDFSELTEPPSPDAADHAPAAAVALLACHQLT